MIRLAMIAVAGTAVIPMRDVRWVWSGGPDEPARGQGRLVALAPGAMGRRLDAGWGDDGDVRRVTGNGNWG